MQKKIMQKKSAPNRQSTERPDNSKFLLYFNITQHTVSHCLTNSIQGKPICACHPCLYWSYGYIFNHIIVNHRNSCTKNLTWVYCMQPLTQKIAFTPITSAYTWWSLVEVLSSPPPSGLTHSHLKGSLIAIALALPIASNTFALVVLVDDTVLSGMA